MTNDEASNYKFELIRIWNTNLKSLMLGEITNLVYNISREYYWTCYPVPLPIVRGARQLTGDEGSYLLKW